MYSTIISNVSVSKTLAISDKAREMRIKGMDIVSLSMGEPDCDTPLAAKQAAIDAIKKGYTKYTAVRGIPELLNAISKKFLKDNNLKFDTSEIIVCTGGKQAIFNALFATLNSSDNVLIPAPHWVSYPDMVRLTGASFKIIKSKDDNKIDLKNLEQSIDKHTKWLILNSPSNPSGVVYTADELREIADILASHPHVNIMSDDVYEKIIYDDINFCNILNVAPELRDRVIIVNSVSKAFAMTGWRIGYAAGPRELISKMAILQSQSISCVSSIAQYAAVAALEKCDDFVNSNIVKFTEKRDFVLNGLNKIKHINVKKPSGAFYILIPCNAFIGKKTNNGLVITDDTRLASYLLEEYLIAVVPGVDFGANNCIRISYATSKENLAKAIDRLSQAFDSIRV